MSLLSNLRKRQTERFATVTPATVATSGGEKARTVATVATVSVAKPPEANASRWWLIHYPDGAPVETWTSPPATHAEILERHPDAIAAQPLSQDSLEVIITCSTCAHATYRGGCGEPVAAGLSALEGVIAYSLDQGATCSAWQLKHPS